MIHIPSLLKDVQSAFCINEAGRQKAVGIAKMFECNDEVIAILESGWNE